MNDPFAPPAPAKKKRRRKAAAAEAEVDVEPHRMGVVVFLVLQAVTGGVFGLVWYFLRRPLFEGLRQERLSPLVLLLGYALLFGGVVDGWLQPSNGIVANTVAILGVFLVFRAQVQLGEILTTAARVRFIDLEISPAGVFFFGSAYLQWGVNRLADGPDEES